MQQGNKPSPSLRFQSMLSASLVVATPAVALQTAASLSAVAEFSRGTQDLDHLRWVSAQKQGRVNRNKRHDDRLCLIGV